MIGQKCLKNSECNSPELKCDFSYAGGSKVVESSGKYGVTQFYTEANGKCDSKTKNKLSQEINSKFNTEINDKSRGKFFCYQKKYFNGKKAKGMVWSKIEDYNGKTTGYKLLCKHDKIYVDQIYNNGKFAKNLKKMEYSLYYYDVMYDTFEYLGSYRYNFNSISKKTQDKNEYSSFRWAPDFWNNVMKKYPQGHNALVK